MIYRWYVFRLCVQFSSFSEFVYVDRICRLILLAENVKRLRIGNKLHQQISHIVRWIYQMHFEEMQINILQRSFTSQARL